MTESFLKTYAPSVQIHRPETQKVACPYCEGGTTEVTALHKAEGGMEIPGFKQPHQCSNDACKRWFKLEPRVQVVGVKLEGE